MTSLYSPAGGTRELEGIAVGCSPRTARRTRAHSLTRPATRARHSRRAAALAAAQHTAKQSRLRQQQRRPRQRRQYSRVPRDPGGRRGAPRRRRRRRRRGKGRARFPRLALARLLQAPTISPCSLASLRVPSFVRSARASARPQQQRTNVGRSERDAASRLPRALSLSLSPQCRSRAPQRRPRTHTSALAYAYLWWEKEAESGSSLFACDTSLTHGRTAPLLSFSLSHSLSLASFATRRIGLIL